MQCFIVLNLNMARPPSIFMRIFLSSRLIQRDRRGLSWSYLKLWPVGLLDIGQREGQGKVYPTRGNSCGYTHLDKTQRYTTHQLIHTHIHTSTKYPKKCCQYTIYTVKLPQSRYSLTVQYTLWIQRNMCNIVEPQRLSRPETAHD